MKYIVVSRYGNTIYPKLFKNETDAYKYYAKNLLNATENMNYLGKTNDLEYPKDFDKEKDVAKIKNDIIDLMSSLMDKTGKVQKTDNGYIFGWDGEYTLEIFEVEEN